MNGKHLQSGALEWCSARLVSGLSQVRSWSLFFSQAKSEEGSLLPSEVLMSGWSKNCFRPEGTRTGVFRVKARALAAPVSETWPPVLIPNRQTSNGSKQIGGCVEKRSR